MGSVEPANFLDGTGHEAAARARERRGLEARYAAPSGAVEERLAEIWRAALDIDRIGVDDDFFELGGDSLAGAQIFAIIEQEFGRRIPLSTLVEQPTIRGLAAYLAGDRPAAADDLLVPLGAGGGGPPLFCVHELSGNVVVYRRLAARLGGDRPVYGLQYPGQHLADPPRLSLADMAARYCAAVRGVQGAGPYYLAGFSLGGTIAYEMALHLVGEGQEVGLLALLDTTAPGSSPRGLARVARHIGEFAHHPPAAWPAYFMRRWRNRRARQRNDKRLYRSASSDDLGARLERLASEILPQAGRGYAPGPYQGRVVLFRCAEDRALWRGAPDLGWNALVAGGVETRDIPATHQYMMQEPAVAVLAEQLEDCLRQARRTATGEV